MPNKNPRFWLEIFVLGFVLVVGMAVLTVLLDNPWAFLARIVFAAGLFTAYAGRYNRTWNGRR